jgi:hypothetical protein
LQALEGFRLQRAEAFARPESGDETTVLLPPGGVLYGDRAAEHQHQGHARVRDRSGIPFYWRVELTATGIPIVYAYLLDSASRRFWDGEVFTGLVKATVPSPVEIDLSGPW